MSANALLTSAEKRRAVMQFTYLHVLGRTYILQRVQHPQHGFTVLVICRRRENSEWHIRKLVNISG